MKQREQSCPNCDSPITANARPNIAVSREEIPPDSEGVPEGNQVAWELDIPLITNRFILYDMSKALGISGFFLALLFGGITLLSGNGDGFLYMLALVGICLGIFGLAMVFGMVVFFGNRIPARFELNKRGARVLNISRRSKVGNRLAVVLGLFRGMQGLSTAGAGMLAVAQERSEIKWSDVRKVNFHPAQGVISLMNNWRVALLRVVEHELTESEVTVHFGWPMSSWLDRLAVGVMVFNLMRLPRLFKKFNFEIKYRRRLS